MNLLKKYLEQFRKACCLRKQKDVETHHLAKPLSDSQQQDCLATGIPSYIYIISTLACAVAQHCSLTFFPPACTCTRQTWFDEQGRNTSVAGSPMPHSWTFWPVTLKCGDYLQPEQWEQSPSRPVRTETRCKDKFSHGILGAIFPATSWNFVFRHAEQHCHREQRIL